MRYFRHPYFRGLFAEPGGERYGLSPTPRPLPSAAPAAAPPAAAMTMHLTQDQVAALTKKARPGESPADVFARFCRTAGGKPEGQPPTP